MSSLINGLTVAPDRADAAIRMLAEQGAQLLQDSAKENRKWTDRTGQARQRLHSDVSKVANGYKIYLAHGVDYGIWLELANERRFAIIETTIEYVGTFEIMPGFNKLLERLGST